MKTKGKGGIEYHREEGRGETAGKSKEREIRLSFEMKASRIDSN